MLIFNNNNNNIMPVMLELPIILAIYWPVRHSFSRPQNGVLHLLRGQKFCPNTYMLD